MELIDNLVTAEDFLSKGVVKAERGDYIGAVEDYSQAIILNPKYARAYGNRGLLRANQGDIVGAMEDYQKAAQLFLAQGSIANYQMVVDYIKKLEQ